MSDSSRFKPGQKVRCIAPTPTNWFQTLHVGEIYTVDRYYGPMSFKVKNCDLWFADFENYLAPAGIPVKRRTVTPGLP